MKAKDHPYFKMTKAAKRSKAGKADLEKGVHNRVVQWIRYQYPKIRFYSSLDGEYRSIKQAARTKNLKSHSGFPDLLIFESTPYYVGLALEIKASTPYKLNGELKSSDHLKAQNDWLNYLSSNEWAAFFADEDSAKHYIKKYLDNKHLKRLL